MPFKLTADDREWGSAMLYRAESLRDHFIVRWRGYKRAESTMLFALGFWEWWYDPRTVAPSRGT